MVESFGYSRHGLSISFRQREPPQPQVRLILMKLGSNGVKESQPRTVLSFYAKRIHYFGPRAVTPAQFRHHQFIPRNQCILARPNPIAASALRLAVQFLCFKSGLMGCGYLCWPAGPYS